MPAPVPRTRTDESNTLTIPGLFTTRSSGIENKVHSSEAIARAYRPSWYEDPWFPEPPLTTAVVGGRKMDDYLVPGVKKLIAEGVVIPTNPLSSIDRDYPAGLATFGIVSRRVYFQSGIGWRTEWISHQFFARPAYSAPAMPAQDLNRLTAARAAMQAGYMDLLTSAAEFQKTVALIVAFRSRVLLAIDDLVLAWSKRNKYPFRTYTQALESLSSFWLEWRFGWRILWYDYLGIISALNDINGAELRRPFRNRVTMESESTSTAVLATSTQIANLIGTISTIRTTENTTQYSGGCLGDGRLICATIDPLVTAWEILPLTVVLDMFWNLGDWIAANSPFAQVTEVDAWTSVQRSISESVAWKWVPPTASGVEVMKQLQPVGATSVRVETVRVPQLGVSTPISIDVNLSPGKIFDIAAIAFILRKVVLRRVKTILGGTSTGVAKEARPFRY